LVVESDKVSCVSELYRGSDIVAFKVIDCAELVGPGLPCNYFVGRLWLGQKVRCGVLFSNARLIDLKDCNRNVVRVVINEVRRRIALCIDLLTCDRIIQPRVGKVVVRVVGWI